MAITNYERIGKALELLKTGLGPFVEREIRATFQGKAPAQIASFMRDDRLYLDRPVGTWDAA